MTCFVLLIGLDNVGCKAISNLDSIGEKGLSKL